MPLERVETLIVGGGQAGLAMSHMLSKRGKSHVVLERRRVGERWRTERWDGLRFQFPNWSVRLPDFSFPHSDPDAFATSGEIVEYLSAYAAFIEAPIRCGVDVTALRRHGGPVGFIAETSAGLIEAANVVVATGPYQRPVIPEFQRDDAPIFQVHASRYRGPDQLPPGAVLVVGSGASGAQIAEELLLAGRRVYLSVGRHRRMPRRYRGRDLIWWLETLGLDRTPVEQRGPEQPLPLITGAYGGHTIDFRDFAARGVILLGRLVAERDGEMEFARDLAEEIARGDATLSAFLDRVDLHIQQNGLEVPEDRAAHIMTPTASSFADPPRRVDLQAAGIAAIIWATGYGYDFKWIDLPVLDAKGAPIHDRGVGKVPGLYFIGLQWLSKMNSSFLAGVGDDAARLADHIAASGRK